MRIVTRGDVILSYNDEWYVFIVYQGFQESPKGSSIEEQMGGKKNK